MMIEDDLKATIMLSVVGLRSQETTPMRCADAIQQQLEAGVANGGLAVWNLLDTERLVILRTPELVSP
jgi:hypothetical protein